MSRQLAFLLLFGWSVAVWAGPGEEPPPVAEAPAWRATKATESPRSRALRRMYAYAGATAIAVLLASTFYMYGRWYNRRVHVLCRAHETPLISGPGHVAELPPTPSE